MTGSTVLLLALTLVVAVVDWIAVSRANRPLEYLAKPLTMVVLIAAALALEPDDPAARAWFVAALALSLAGDVFLMLPSDRFVEGLSAFLLGHVAYIVGLHSMDLDGPAFVVGIVVVLVAVAFLGRAIVGALRRSAERAFAGPVVAYMAVISALVASAIGTTRPTAIVGASLFYASDALIAWNRFVAPVRNARVLIMVTYHLGQIGLVVSLV